MSYLNGSSLKLVREFLGKNQSEFARQLGISQPSISKIEKNEKQLENELAITFNEFFTIDFFKNEIENVNPKLYYRKLASINKSMLSMFESRINLIYNTLSKALDVVDIKDFSLPKIDPLEYDNNFDYISTEIRLALGIGRGPIKDLIRTLERSGIIIHFIDFDFITEENRKFDGVSFYVKGSPVILINRKIPNSRKAFTISHELGHLLMHFDNVIHIERDIEDEANKFASSFLLPEKEIKSSLRRLTEEKLFELKLEWNTSVQALVYRAYTIGNISSQTLRFWMMKLAKYRKLEPQEFYIEPPILFDKILELTVSETDNLFFNDLGFTERLRAELFGINNIPERTKLKILI